MSINTKWIKNNKDEYRI